MKRDERRTAQIFYQMNLSRDLVRHWIIGLCEDGTISQVKSHRKFRLNRSITTITRECALHWLNVVRSRRVKYQQQIYIPKQPQQQTISLAHVPPRKLAPELYVDLIPNNFNKPILFPSSSSSFQSFQQQQQEVSNKSFQQQQQDSKFSHSNLNNSNDEYKNDNNNHHNLDHESKESFESDQEEEVTIITDEEIILIEQEVNELYSKLSDKSYLLTLNKLERNELSQQLDYYIQLLENLSQITKSS